MHDAYYCLKYKNDLIKEHNINSCWVANWSKEYDCVVHVHNFKLQNTFEMHKLKLFKAAPVADWVKLLNYSAHNHLIVSPLCLVLA